MKIFLTGASGFLGAQIARQLLAQGDSVRALVQPQDSAHGLAGLGVERCVGDLLQPDGYASALQGCDAVVHAAGKVILQGRARARLEALHVAGLKNLLTTAEQYQLKRFLLVSSAGVLGATAQPLCVDETHPALGPSVFSHTYHRSKWQAEKLFFEFLAPGLTRIAVLPAMLWGPGDWHRSSTGYALRGLQGKTLYYTSGGTNILDVEDAARGVVLALQQGRDGERYLFGGENITTEQMCRWIAQACHRLVPLCRTTPVWAYVLGALAEGLGRVGWEMDFSLDIARMLGNYWWVNPAKARQALGFVPRYSAQQSIARTVEWYRTTGGWGDV